MENKCKHHDKSFEGFCISCNQLICVSCIFSDHKNHKFQSLEEYQQNLATSHKSMATNYAHRISAINDRVDADYSQHSTLLSKYSGVVKDFSELNSELAINIDEMNTSYLQQKQENLINQYHTYKEHIEAMLKDNIELEEIEKVIPNKTTYISDKVQKMEILKQNIEEGIKQKWQIELDIHETEHSEREIIAHLLQQYIEMAVQSFNTRGYEIQVSDILNYNNRNSYSRKSSILSSQSPSKKKEWDTLNITKRTFSHIIPDAERSKIKAPDLSRAKSKMPKFYDTPKYYDNEVSSGLNWMFSLRDDNGKKEQSKKGLQTDRSKKSVSMIINEKRNNTVNAFMATNRTNKVNPIDQYYNSNNKRYLNIADDLPEWADSRKRD